MRYRDAFLKATSREPYPYQERVAALVEKGSNLIVTAPTGSGKTAASVVPFLSTWGTSNCPGDRLLYVTPLRVLTRTLHKEATQMAGRLFGGSRIVSSGVEREWDSAKFYIAQQMGGVPDDPYFLADITFTTIDQLLSAAIFHPVSLPRKVATLAAGALPGSYLVLDEVHLLEPEKSLATVLALLRLLRGSAQFVLMTATLSRAAREWIAKGWSAEIVEVPEAERLLMAAEKTRSRVWHFASVALDVGAVKRFCKGRTLVVVNTVGRAQELARALLASPPPGYEVLLLHSRFLASDRRRIENRVLELFGRDSEVAPTNVILVATQVVEVGLDISCDVLLTELAPMNALVQRAGRCARWGGEGRVVVFPLLEGRGAEPYDENTVKQTRLCLQELGADEQEITFAQEQAWIEEVHGPQETLFLNSLDVAERQTQIFLAAANKSYRSAVRELIRDVAEIPVLVTESPTRDWPDVSGAWPELVSASPRGIQRLLRAASRGEPGLDVPSLAWVPEPIEAEDETTTWTWRSASPEEITGAWLVALSPKIASYSPTLGLTLGREGTPMPIIPTSGRPLRFYLYRREGWLAHALATLKQADNLLRFHRVAVSRLAKSLANEVEPWLLLEPAAETAAEHIQRCVLLCAVLHDTGKLSLDWQRWAAMWQHAQDATQGAHVYDAGDDLSVGWEPLAHTDFAPVAGYGAQHRIFPRRPPHAVLGALIALPILASELVRPLDLLAFNVIARHHGVDVEHAGSVSPLHQTAYKNIADVVSHVGVDLADTSFPPTVDQVKEWATDVQDLLFTWTTPEERAMWPSYTVVSRLVRLADQLATATRGAES